MNLRFRRHLLLPLLAAGILGPLLSPAGASAATSSAGTDFWLGLPAAALQPMTTAQFVLELTATATTSGTVSVPGTQFSHSFTVEPGSPAEVAVPLSVEDAANDSVSTGQGVHVIAGRAVTVDAVYEDSGVSDGYLGLPTDLLGNSYVVAAVPGNAACGSSEFEIVGTQDGTTVSITPSAAVAAHPAAATYTKQLNTGSTYLAQASGTGDLTGSLIASSKPVAVLAGNSCGQVPTGTSFANALMEQEPPVSQWGTAFFTLPFATRTGGDYYTILTSQPNTTILRNGASLATVGAAHASVTELISSASHLTADKPILVMHLATGGEFMADSNGDPTMIAIPPTSLYTRIQTVGLPSGFANNYLNVTIANSDIATLTLDGTPVTASLFHPVGDSTTESGAQLAVAAGAHTLVAAGPFGVEAYGFDPTTFDAYGFPGALGVPARAAGPQITVRTPANGATYAAGQTVRAAYSCTAATGTTIRSCAGPVANGALVATSVPGMHSFTVTATDFYGGHASRTVTYHVAEPSNRITVVSKRADPATGAETVTVRVPGPGALSGVETSSTPRLVVARDRLSAPRAGRFELTFKPSRKARRVLRHRHKLAVKIALTFTPTHGKSRTTTVQATIRLH